jgi:xylose dehydrogenase (NAD/NADP)
MYNQSCGSRRPSLPPSDTRRLRWGVLGGARIARLCVIPAIHRSRNGEIRGIACRSGDRSQVLAQEHRIPLACGRYEEILENPEIEAVYIPLPNHLHKEWTVRAVEAGKHVLCEKPLAVNAQEAREMVQAARKRGVYLMEAFMYRFHPRSLRIKSLVDRGAVGDPRLIRSAFCFRLPDRQEMRFRPEMGGGALLDVGCYGVSLARWILGAEPEAVQAMADYGPTGTDVTVVGLLRFPEGRVAVLEASLVSALQQTYSIAGTEGMIELPHNAFIPWEKDACFRVRAADEEDGTVEIIPGADEYQLMVENFADAVLDGRQLAYPAEDSVKNMQVLDALSRSAREGREIRMAGRGGGSQPPVSSTFAK